MSSIIKLTFYNESDLEGTPHIVLFQKHLIGGAQGAPIAWKVIQNLGRGDYHPFQFVVVPQMSVKGSSGTQVGSLIDVAYSSSYVAVTDSTGDKIAQNLLTVPLINRFENDTISVEIFRGGNLLAVTKDIEPRESVVFQFDQVLWMGIANNVKQGEKLNIRTQAKIHTGLNLEGISTAEIVMTGGGTQPVTFNLRNIT